MVDLPRITLYIILTSEDGLAWRCGTPVSHYISLPEATLAANRIKESSARLATRIVSSVWTTE
jgi:hypothetical protein